MPNPGLGRNLQKLLLQFRALSFARALVVLIWDFLPSAREALETGLAGSNQGIRARYLNRANGGCKNRSVTS